MKYKDLVKTALVVAGLFLFQIGCKTRENTAHNQLKHDVGEPVQEAIPYYWHDSSYDDFRQGAKQNLHAFQLSEALTTDDPLVKRLQYWADQIHDKIILSNPKIAKIVPKPRVLVVPGKSIDAFSTAIPVCLNIPFITPTDKLKENPEEEIERASIDFLDVRPTSVFSPFNPFQYNPPCFNAAWSNDIDGFITWFNKIDGPCRLKKVSEGLTVEGPECDIFVSAKKAKMIEFSAASSVITISAPMIEYMGDEKLLVAVLAHEIGHYYRGHAVVGIVPTMYNYFYQEEIKHPPHKPAPTADNDDLMRGLNKKVSYIPRGVKNAHYQARTQRYIVGMLPYLLEETCGKELVNCTESCKTLKEESSKDWAITMYNEGTLSEDQRKSYANYETLVQKCSADITVIEGASGNKNLDMKSFMNLLSNAKLDFVTSIPVNVKLAEALEYINGKDLLAQKEQKTFIDSLKTRHLGYYTAEQEADDFSLEAMAAIGIDPKQMEAAQYRSIEGFGKKDPEAFIEQNDISFEECERLRRQDWIDDSNGEKIYRMIFVGTLFDTHHGGCYRLFNASREINAHQHKLVPASHPPMTPSWEETMARMKKLNEFWKDRPLPEALPQPGSGVGSGSGNRGLMIDTILQ